MVAFISLRPNHYRRHSEPCVIVPWIRKTSKRIFFCNPTYFYSKQKQNKHKLNNWYLDIGRIYIKYGANLIFIGPSRPLYGIWFSHNWCSIYSWLLGHIEIFGEIIFVSNCYTENKLCLLLNVWTFCSIACAHHIIFGCVKLCWAISNSTI